MTNTIPLAEWQPFLLRFTRDHAGRPAMVRVRNGHGWMNVIPSATLRDVVYRAAPCVADAGACDILVIGDGPLGQVEHTVLRPVGVRVTNTVDGKPISLMIEPFNGPPTVVQLKYV